MIRKTYDSYRIQVNKTVYYIGFYLTWDNRIKLKCYNRSSIWTFYNRFRIGPGQIANECFGKEIYCCWQEPFFNTSKEALKFLYFLDMNYNPTP